MKIWNLGVHISAAYADDLSGVDGACPNEDDLSGVDETRQVNNLYFVDLDVKASVALLLW